MNETSGIHPAQQAVDLYSETVQRLNDVSGLGGDLERVWRMVIVAGILAIDPNAQIPELELDPVATSPRPPIGEGPNRCHISGCGE